MAGMPNGMGTKREVLESLRRDLSRLESHDRPRPALSLGIPEIDRRLTGGQGLLLGGLHEIVGTGYPDMAAASGFGAALGARLMRGTSRALLWVVQGTGSHDLGALYGPGLAMMGLDPARLLLVRVRDDREALWVTEEALKTPDLAGVVTELGSGRAYDLKASRRLQLAAEKFGRPALLLAGHAAGAASAPSAALTRFRITSAVSRLNSLTPAAPGRLRFSVHLDRVRGGAPCHFLMEWMHETHCFAVAAGLSRGTDAAPGRHGTGGAAAAAGTSAPRRARQPAQLAM